QDLISTFPAAVQIGGEDLGAPTFLRLLERWPTANALAGVSRAELVAFARSCRHARPERFADKVEASLVAGALQAQGLPGAGQGRARRGVPARAQPLPRRGCAAVGVLLAPALRVGS